MIKFILAFLYLIAWLIVFIIAINGCFVLVSAPDTLLNILGALGIVVTTALGIAVMYLVVTDKIKKDD